MTRKAVIIASAEMEFNGIEEHRGPDIGPTPYIASDIATLVFPPVAATAVATHRGEMLHQETCVDRDEQAWAEPTEEAENLAHAVAVFKRRFL